MISKTYLSNNEQVGIDVLEITSIPSLSIISDSDNIEMIVRDYQKEISSMLSEIYQYYKIQSAQGDNKEICVELMWLSKPVKNQTYKADIKLYLIIRSISKYPNIIDEDIVSVRNVIQGTLEKQKYDLQDISIEKYQTALAGINKEKIVAIVKEESIENLQNSILPYCFSYDIIPNNIGQQLSKIVGIMKDTPNCAVSFQLIPSVYSYGELNDINSTSQILDTLFRGVSDQNVGNISFSLAEKVSKTYKYYSQNKNNALYLYNILIWGSQIDTSNIASKIYGQLTPTSALSANLKFITLSLRDIDIENNLYPLPWAANEIIINTQRELWNNTNLSANLYRLPYLISADESSEFFRLPIGNKEISAGFKINETGRNSKTYSQNIINSGDIELGILKSSSDKNSIGLSLKDLAKHMLIVGTPGSGKTTFSVGLLDRLWKEHHIPFLVIEPAKNEYRALVQSIPELQVFTPGKNFISPFVFNPFVPPKNVKLETYKSTLKTAFAAGVSMSTPLDKIFEEAINNCYSDFKWLDSYTVDNNGKIFNIADFIKCFQDTFDAIGYTGDAKNIGRAGVVRLKSLANLFDNYFSIPIEDILNKPTIIELAAIENSDQKALIIALILLSTLAYVNANYVGEGGLRNFILLEEAHVLLDTSSSGGEGAANPAAIAQGLIKRMLAEIRSYGVGLAIADQSPRKVGIDIVALTDIKVAFRLVESQDKQILADSTSMNDTQISRLAKLKPGEAFLFFNKLEEPEEIITPDYRLVNNISISLSDTGIKQLTTYWNDKQINLRPYPECALTPYCQNSCSYEQRLLAKEIARRIFNKNIPIGTKNIEDLKSVMMRIQTLVLAELNDEKFDRKLLSCVKVHLWRKVKYETKINISDGTIKKSLVKE